MATSCDWMKLLYLNTLLQCGAVSEDLVQRSESGGVLQKDPNFKILSYLFGNHGNFS